MHTTFAAFGTPPTAGDALLVGLDDPAPNCAVRIEFDGRVEGIGVNPSRPPLVWEAWTGEEWTECLLGLDETGGLNRSGAVIVHVPGEHQPSVIGGDRAGWLRARVVQPEEGQPPYTEAPMVHGLTACTVGGTADALHGEIVAAETLGESEGVPGQSFTVSRAPILAGADPIVEIGSADGWQEWTLVDHFAASAPHDRHFVLDASNGVVSRTAGCAGTARCRRWASRCGSAATSPAAARPATSPPARSTRSSRPSRSWRAWRTCVRRRAVSPARR
jgi:predicted phage baseplate assembly protein